GKSEFAVTRVDPEFARELQKYGVTFSGEFENPFLQNLLSWVVAALLMVGVWMLLVRRIGQGAGGLMSIGKSKAKIYVESDTGVRFDDVAGVDEAKGELREIVAFLKNPERYSRLGGRMPSGILLKLCWQRPWRGRQVYPSFPSPAPNLSRCSSASAQLASAISSSRHEPRRRPSFLSTNSTL